MMSEKPSAAAAPKLLGSKRTLDVTPTENLWEDLRSIVRFNHDVRDDDRALRAVVASPDPGPGFDASKALPTENPGRVCAMLATATDPKSGP